MSLKAPSLGCVLIALLSPCLALAQYAELRLDAGRSVDFSPEGRSADYERTYFSSPRGETVSFELFAAGRIDFLSRTLDKGPAPVFGLRVGARAFRFDRTREDAAAGRRAALESSGWSAGPCAGLFWRPWWPVEVSFCNGVARTSTRTRFVLSGKPRATWSHKDDFATYDFGVSAWNLAPFVFGLNATGELGGENALRGGIGYAL